MANGIGKIAMGRQRASTYIQKGRSQAPQIEYQLGNQIRQEDSASKMGILESLAGLHSSWKGNMKSWDKFDAGAEAAGISTEAPSFLQKASRGLGISSVDLSKKHAGGEGIYEYSGAELMGIGEKANTGTLASFLDGGDISSKFGSKTKGYQAFEQFGKEGQDWQGYRSKTLEGKGVGTDYGGGIGALGVSRGVGGEKGLLSDDDLMSTITTPPDMLNRGDSHQSLVRDTYGEPDKDRYVESSEQRAARERMYTQTGQKRQPNDPMATERQRYQEGIVARKNDEMNLSGSLRDKDDPLSWGGNFEEGSTIEDMWAKDENKPSPHTAPGGFAYNNPQPDAASDVSIYDLDSPESMQEQLTRDAEGGYQMDANELASIQPEAQRMSNVAKADAAGTPIDPMSQQRLNAERKQLGQKDAMSLEQILDEQDRLANLLNPD